MLRGRRQAAPECFPGSGKMAFVSDRPRSVSHPGAVDHRQMAGRHADGGSHSPMITGGLPLPQEITERWQARFRAPRVTLPDWAQDAPHRCVYASDLSGVVEQYAWDRELDTHRQVTDRPNGTLMGTVSPDGETLWWFADTRSE